MLLSMNSTLSALAAQRHQELVAIRTRSAGHATGSRLTRLFRSARRPNRTFAPRPVR
jgi:hypothetical protein